MGAFGRSVACRGIAEVEAESISYLVTTAAGLDCGAYSVPYVAGWSSGNAALLRQTASRVLTIATRVELDLARVGCQVPEMSSSGPIRGIPATALARPPMTRPDQSSTRPTWRSRMIAPS